MRLALFNRLYSPLTTQTMQVPGLHANFRDSSMMTPLMWSAFHGKPEHIEKLKERGGGMDLILNVTMVT